MAKILLVEDDNNLREIYEARLQAEGYDIVSAMDGEEALVVAKKEKPDLVISDVMMPRISGFEMLDILRNTEGLKDVKVIMLTALGQAEDKTRADSLGADRYLVKSQVTLEDIVKAAQELLGPADGSAATPAADSAALAAAAATAAPTPEPEPTSAPVTPSPAPTPEPAAVPTPSPMPTPTPPQPSVTPQPAVPTVPAPAPVVPSTPEPVAPPVPSIPSPTAPTPSPTPAAPAMPNPAPAPAEPSAPTMPEPPTMPSGPSTPSPSPMPAPEPTMPTPETPAEPAQPSPPAPDMTPTAPPAPVAPTPEPQPPLGPTQPPATETPTPAPSTPSPAPADDLASTANEAQSASAEEDTIKAQIESFVSQNNQTAPGAAPVEEPKAAEEKPAEDKPETPTAPNNTDFMADAIKGLVADTDEGQQPQSTVGEKTIQPPSEADKKDAATMPAPDVVAPSSDQDKPAEPEQPSTPDDSEDDNVGVAHKKIISPITDSSEAPQSDLNALLAKEGFGGMDEMHQENYGTPSPQNPTGLPTAPHPPGHVISPNPSQPGQGNGVDPNSIAL